MALDFGVASNETVWQAEPRGRGTYGLVSSCVITMVLCIWTAVHLNFPDYDEPEIKYLPPRQTLRRIFWLLMGLFAPEIVPWTAFEQRKEAKDLSRHVKSCLGEMSTPSLMNTAPVWARKIYRRPKADLESGIRPASETGHTTTESVEEATDKGILRKERRHKWTMTHSFYVLMGGFAFDADAFGRDMLPGGRKRVTLTTRGICELARVAPHLLPDISVAHIEDKSKANRLAKRPLSWFSAQCISRPALSLTVSLLELNTLAHALCALVAYYL